MKSYRKLEEIFKRVRDLEDILKLLEWDFCILMPAKSLKYRSNQIILLKDLIHNILSNNSLEDLINSAKSEDLNQKQKTRLKEMSYLHRHYTDIPACLMKDFIQSSSECATMWKETKEQNNYNKILPCFKRLVGIVKEIASLRAKKSKTSSYNALMSFYNPVHDVEYMDNVFAKLGPFIRDFLKEVTKHQKKRKIYKISKNIYKIDKQKEVILSCVKKIGFNFTKGRFDRGLHPFFISIANEIRVGTKYYEDSFLNSLKCIMYESGHSIYEMNLSDDYYSRPHHAGPVSHEILASLLENHICQSKEFIEFVAPMFKKAFDGRGKAWEADNLHNMISSVNPSAIRMNSDEISYMAHTMLRYSLEKEMIKGDLSVEDLPVVWEDGLKHYFGSVPQDSQDGCMQDVHWFSGTFGYFPVQAVATMFSAQLFLSLKNSKTEYFSKINKGDFTNLNSWINKDFCRKEYPNNVKDVIGKDLDVDCYISYLSEKYLQQI